MFYIICLLGIFFLYFFYFYWSYFNNTIGGPIPLPFIGNIFFFCENEKNTNKIKLLLYHHKSFGPIWETFLPTKSIFKLERGVHISLPIDLKCVLKDSFNNFEKGKIQYEIFYDLLGDGIFNSDGEKWKNQRKIASHKFSRNNLKLYMLDIFCKHADNLINNIENIEQNRFFDIQHLFFKYTFDAICEIGMGIDSSTLDKKFNSFGKSFDIIQELIEKRFFNPLWKIQNRLKIGDEKYFNKNIKNINNFIYNIIEKRKKETINLENKKDILSLFMLNESNNFKLKDVITNFLIAGRDTTATALTWAIYALCKDENQEILLNLREEIFKIIKFEKPTFKKIQSMSYLYGFISEILRLYAPVPIDTKICVKDTQLPSGIHINKDDRIFYSPLLMGHIDAFWDQPEKIKPERWIENRNISQYIFPVFNAGYRLCLGKEMAYLEISVVLIYLLRNFDFCLLSDNIEQITKITLNVKNGLFVSAY